MQDLPYFTSDCLPLLFAFSTFHSNCLDTAAVVFPVNTPTSFASFLHGRPPPPRRLGSLSSFFTNTVNNSGLWPVVSLVNRVIIYKNVFWAMQMIGVSQ